MSPVPHANPHEPRKLLQDLAFDRLRAAIEDGTLLPGEVLRDSELELWLGASKTPIRQAIARLASIGLVEMVPNRFTRVALIDVAEAREAYVLAGRLHRLAVETVGSELTPANVATLRTLNDEFQAAVEREDKNAALDADERFHGAFLEWGGMRLTTQIMSNLMPIVRRIRTLQFDVEAAWRSVQQHNQIIELCAEGRISDAARAVEENWRPRDHIFVSLAQYRSTPAEPAGA